MENALSDAEEKALLMAKTMEDIPGQLPRSIDAGGNLVTSEPGWWCSGFFPGVLWYLYENSGNERTKYYASEMTKRVSQEQYNTSTHDLGFMLYCSYGNAWRIIKEDSCKNVLLNGSGSLATRFNPTVGCIQSWEASEKWRYPVIIDNMMNLEMLMWAYRATGDELFRNICVSHADKTIANQFRADNSSYHVVSYSPETGGLEFQGTDQGCSDESAWARGQAWGLYGFTMMYRETENPAYLGQANKIARFILDHKNLPEDKIP
ncbi:MAG: glycoside hydrolase family 88 protein, partial [Candidatus Symbiothrix sp.]|nr:glycoside hydrolase family 88 protein [Candidatus Symbiothrix sp.]